MKNENWLWAIILLISLGSIIGFSACNKDNEAAENIRSEQPVSQNELSRLKDQKHQIENLNPEWDKAKKREDLGKDVLEVPLGRMEKFVTLDPTGLGKIGANQHRAPTEAELALINRQKASLLIDESAPENKRFQLGYWDDSRKSSTGELKADPLDFTGNLIRTDKNGKLISGLKYDKGKVVGSFSVEPPSLLDDEAARAARVCTTNAVTYTYYIIEIYFFNNVPVIVNVTTEYVLVYELDCYEVGGSGGGSGGGIGPQGGGNNGPIACPPPTEYLQMQFAMNTESMEAYTYINPLQAVTVTQCLRSTPGVVNGTYKIGIYVKQPVPNTNSSYQLLTCPNATWGYSYIYLESEETFSGGGISRKQVSLSYLPVSNTLSIGPTFNQMAPANLAACGGYMADVSLIKTVSAQEYDQVLQNILSYLAANPLYSINESNSTDFVLASTANLGLNLVPCTASWIPNGTGSSAGILGQKIRQMANTSTIVVDPNPSVLPVANTMCVIETHVIN